MCSRADPGGNVADIADVNPVASVSGDDWDVHLCLEALSLANNGNMLTSAT